MDTTEFFNEYKIAPVSSADNLRSLCDLCALHDNCGEYFYDCPAPVGYNFQKKGGDQ